MRIGKKNKMDKLDAIEKEMMQDEEFKDNYANLGPRFAIIRQVVESRIEQNMTQSELAKRMGTKKSNISRFESGKYNPSLNFIIKIADVLGKKIEVFLK